MNIEFVAPARIDDVLVVETILPPRGPRLTAGKPFVAMGNYYGKQKFWRPALT